MFAWPGATLVGNQLESLALPRSDALKLLGHWKMDQVMETIYPDRPAARFSGWCVTRDTHRVPDFVLICQGNGKAVGLGRFISPRPDKSLKQRLPANSMVGFEGYIQNYSGERKYHCLAFIDGKLIVSPLRRIGPDSESNKIPET